MRTRDAVDRRPAIVGEALGRLGKLDETMAAIFPDAPQIVALRNILLDDMNRWTTP